VPFFLLEVSKQFALLLGLLYLQSQILPGLMRRFRRGPTFFHAMLFSLTGLMSMVIADPIMPGHYMDERAVIVAVAGAWAGPIPAFSAALTVSLVRLVLITTASGPGNTIASAMAAAALGSAYYLLRQRGFVHYDWRSLVALGLVLALAKIAIVALSPGPYWLELLVLALIFVPVLYAFSIWGLVRLLAYEQRKLEAGAALREHERQFSTVIAATPVPLVISRIADGVCVYVNEPAARAVGATADVLLGRTVADFYYDPDDRVSVIDELARMGYVQNREIRIRRVNGQINWILLSLRPIRFRGERCHLIVFQDLSEQKAAEEALRFSENRFRLFSEATNEGVFLSEGGVICDANQTAARLFGYELDAFIGQHVDDLLVMSQTETEPAPGNGRSEAGDWMGRRSDGTLFYAEVQTRPIERAGVALSLTTIRDLTEHRQAEAQRLALALEQEKVRTLRSFLRAVSHDLRTPLSVINTSLYLARKTRDAAGRDRHLAKAEHQINILARMLDDLQTITRLEHVSSLPVERADLNAFIEQLVQQTNLRLAGHNVRLVTDLSPGLPPVAINAPELAHALSTIIANACDDRTDRVICISSRPNGNGVFIEITDATITIDQHILPHLFEPFYKADAARTDTDKGPGLSLAIARRILELHHGEICVESAPETGSTFRISLPYA